MLFVYVYLLCRHVVHVENCRRLTRFEVRTQVPSLIMHKSVCGAKGDAYIVLWYYGIYTQRLNNNNPA